MQKSTPYAQVLFSDNTSPKIKFQKKNNKKLSWLAKCLWRAKSTCTSRFDFEYFFQYFPILCVIKINLVWKVLKMDDSVKEMDEFELHKCVFDNDLKKLTQLLKANKEIADKKVKFRNFSCLSLARFHHTIHYYCFATFFVG
jgi:hypothetical protein